MNIKERITMFQIIILIMLLPLVGCTKYDNEAIPNDETDVRSFSGMNIFGVRMDRILCLRSMTLA